MEEMKYTNSTAGSTYNENHKQFIDTTLDLLDRNVEYMRKQTSGFTLINQMEQIGIKRDTETIKLICENMPNYSIMIYHKYGEKIDAYPERTGLLTVIKGGDKSRVQFTFTGYDFFYRGFYDNLRGGNDLWSGWRKMIESKDGSVVIDSLKSSDGRPILLNVSIDGNGKNLGWSESRFEQVVAKKGYFDRIEVGGKIIE